MEDKKIYSVAVSSSGEQVLMSGSANVVMGVVFSDDVPPKTIQLDIDESEFNRLQDLATTNDIPDDIIKAKAINN